MHFPDESYVRLYTRKTLTNRMLKWEGRAVEQAMLGGEEFDRAGVFEYVGDPAECIATVTEIPVEIVRIGLERLLKTKTWTLTETAVVWPRYVEAQTCAKSDKTRQSDCRKRRAVSAARGNDGAKRPEPELVSRAVTPSHEPSRNVTPSLADPNQTDPISSDPDRASAQERESLPEPAAEPGPAPSSGTRGGVKHLRFPVGWRWSLKTTAEAVALGLTAADLQGHVDYWTLRSFAVPVDDLDGEGLDGELRRSLAGIAERKRKAESSAPSAGTSPPAGNPYAWAPNAEHRAFAKARGLDLGRAVDAYRAAKMPELLPSSFRADEDFMRRLHWWADNGGDFPATGKRPRREREATPETLRAVGA